MRCYQVRDYCGNRDKPLLRDAQGNHFAVVRYCGSLDVAAEHCRQFGRNDAPTSRANDILVVEVEIHTDKAAVLQILNGGDPVGGLRRAEGGKVYEIGPRGALRESEEWGV